MDCGPPGSSVHRIFQVRILKRVAIPFSRGSSRPRDGTHIPCVSHALADGFFTTIPPGKLLLPQRPSNLAPRYMPREMEMLCSHKTCTWMFIEALLIKASKWKQPKFPSTEWINKSGIEGTSLVVQWLRRCDPNARGLGLILVRELDPTCLS